MMISTKGRYALRILIDLALNADGGYTSLKGVAQRQGLSMKYIESIVALLSKEGFVESLRGKNGGYRLKKAPSEYTVGSVLKITEGTLSPVSCSELSGGNECEYSEQCITLPLWRKLDKIIDDYLGSVTLEDLINRNVE